MSDNFACWFRPRFGVYLWSDRLRVRFSWGPYFVGRWRPSFRHWASGSPSGKERGE